MPEAAALRWPIVLADLGIEERPVQMSVLRLARIDAAVITALSGAFAVDWPVQPNTMRIGAGAIAWLAPREWAVLDLDFVHAAGRVQRACADRLHHLADLCASSVGFTLAGAHAAGVLAKGCSLDLDSRVFGQGRCAQTLLAQVPVLIHRGTDASIRVIAETAVADYLRRWFSDAAIEFDPERA